MDSLGATSLHVVLGIKGGSGFGFLNNPVIVVASLNGNKLETDAFPPSTDLHFDTELVWEADKRYLRRLRTGNTPLKVECYTVVNQNKRERLGYVLLNLKQAQIVPRATDIHILETWYRLIGLRTDTKSHNPGVLLTLKVQEAIDPSTQESLEPKGVNPQNQNTSKKKDKKEIWGNLNFAVGDQPSQQIIKQNNEEYIQIGPADQCTQFFELLINVTSSENLHTLMPSSQINQEHISLRFSIFGNTFNRNFFSQGAVSPGDSLKILLRSRLELLFAYFKEFPSLLFKIQSGETFTVGLMTMSLMHLVPTDDLATFLNSFGRNGSTVVARLSVESPQGLTKHLSEETKPYIGVSTSLLFRGDAAPAVGVDPFNLPEKNVPTLSRDSDGLKSAIPDLSSPVTDKSNLGPTSPLAVPVDTQPIPLDESHNHDIFLDIEPGGSQLTTVPTKEINKATSTENFHTAPEEREEIKVMANKKEPIDIEFCTSNTSSDRDRHSGKYVKIEETLDKDVSVEEILRNRNLAKEAAFKVCEELEDWKERQQELFKFELKRKTDLHMQRLSSEWVKRQKEIENDFQRKMEQCQALTEQLTEASKELAARTELIINREKELFIAQEELDRQYTLKFQELREASRRHQVDTEHTISLIEAEKNDLLSKLDFYEKENARLLQIMKNHQIKEDQLTNDQTAALIIDMKCLEEKLEAALESKSFFKEQWGRAVREIHRLKTEQQEQLRLQIERNKMELEKIGLNEAITRGQEELREDQTIIHNLKAQLQQFHDKTQTYQKLNTLEPEKGDNYFVT